MSDHRSNCAEFHKAISYEHAMSLGADVWGSSVHITRSRSVPYRDLSLKSQSSIRSIYADILVWGSGCDTRRISISDHLDLNSPVGGMP
jgi:hypothetical protein